MTELTFEESLSMFMAEIAKRLDENTNLIKELQASMDFALRNQKASIKALEIQVRQMSIILHEKLSGDLRSSTKIMPRVNDKMISTSVETEKLSIRRIDASQYAVSNLQNRNLFSESKKTTGTSPTRLNDDHWDELKETNGEKDLEAHAKPLSKAMPRKEKDPGRLGDLIPTKLIVELADRTVKRPKGIVENVLVAIINVFKAKITLSVGNDKIFFKSNKPTSNIIKKIYALGLLESRKLGLEARLMGDELRKNISQDPNFEVLIELNDLNEPIKHKRSQIKVFVPTIDEVNTFIHVKTIQRIRHRYIRHILEMDTAYQSPDLAERKEIDNVGGESMIWKF
ncbi:hypothetical protein Tco_0980420 [Tanacetum coccineum]